MKFWEAMKVLEEGKKIRPVSWKKEHYLKKYKGTIVDQSGDFFTELFHCMPSETFEIVEEPELYWQWITRDGKIIPSLLTEKQQGPIAYDSYKFAGPWIKTEDGFKKAGNWEQF